VRRPGRLIHCSVEVPNSLGKAGVKRDEVARIVESVQEEVNFAGVVDRPVTVDEIAALLEAAYD
jgi:alcohol dehydrogenase class IV